MGIQVGRKTSIDKRGRVTIPSDMRERLGLKPEQSISVELRDQEIVLKPSLQLDSFVVELKGCVKGSKMRPEDVKEIWGMIHAHN